MTYSIVAACGPTTCTSMYELESTHCNRLRLGHSILSWSKYYILTA